MNILNFGHPLTDALRAELIERFGYINVYAPVSTQLSEDLPIAPQVEALLDSAGLDLVNERFLVILPGFASYAATLLALIHGRAGYFPTVITLKRDPTQTSVVFIINEILDLSAVRLDARAKRDGR